MEQVDLWLEFEIWEPTEDEDPEDDFFNMSISMRDGTRYALNVWTYKFFARDQQHRQISGEHLHGKYTLPPDLFVQKLDRQLMEEIVADLILTNGLRKEWIVSDEA